ncbi:penicillin-binding protein 1C [Rhodosalinus halophilus]|uniref:peptidoglycan glycosyltransferase n=1 Tax=Rhodosalinus halophilus TaxID=2259333 RepID=A0A365U4H0_9RHOB|nr:penicillin-binding protein 1C [Rhodosalinus halophilus]RBI83121.1 penicillin-binding protein 1C [Rhodosalinus halophilus]
MRRTALLWLAALLFLAAAGRDVADRWVAATVLPPLVPETSVEMRAEDGTLMRAFTVADGRWRLAPGEVDARFIDMLLAYEDKRFRSHAGVDPLALIRAAGQAAANGRIVSGGSTLTMQVARLLEDSGTGRWAGKLRQMRVALALERRLTKDEILRLYLTLAPYGGNLEGVRAATRAWFGKEPRRLTPAEAALLVALPQSPEARRPDRDPIAARTARDRVLMRMAGAGVLTAEDAAAAARDPVPQEMRAFPAQAPHLANRLRRARPAARLHTVTLDPALQASLEALARQALAGLDPRLSLALMVADHRTGRVLATVGAARWGAEARDGWVDMTIAPRSPGSTLKPLVYALALDRGLAHPQTLIDDRPVAFGAYAPTNFDGRFRGEVTVEEALRASLNIPVVLLTEEMGPAHLIAALERAGAAPRLPGGRAGLAVALGGVGVTLEELVQLYAGLARGGRAVRLAHRPGATEEGRALVSRAAAWQVGHVLAGLAPPAGAPRMRLAWKTGTSYGHRDAWALGWDGRHVAGVWIGRPDGTPVPGAFGAELAAPVLFRVFERLGGTEPLAPPPPEALVAPTAALPQPLRRFRGREAVFGPAPDAPQLAFPPEGAVLDLAGGPLVVKLREGTPPFAVLADGRPVATGARRREIALPDPGAGFLDLAVIDAEGRTARARVELRQD